MEFDHEAILGSKREAQDFDKLSPEEAKRRLKILLEKMDRNGDKSIERYIPNYSMNNFSSV